MSVTASVTRPYSGPEDDSLPDSVQKLPKHGREIFTSAFNSAWDSYDPDESAQDSQEGYAMAVAWAAVKKVYKQNEDGEWVERSFQLGSYEGVLTRVASRDGVVTWRTTCSDDGVDVYATRMTTELHDDFIRRAQVRGLPWLTIGHYNQLARIGRATKLYRDGRRLKAEGVFFTSDELARQQGLEPDDLTIKLATAAAAASLAEQGTMPRLRKIRTSIGFEPLGAVTEDLGVVGYTRGYLPEITMTTHPANSRVNFGAQEQRSGDMTKRISPEFMAFDAGTIVGEELAGELDKRLRKVIGETRSEGGDDDPAELLYRSLGALEEMDVAALDEVGLIAAARRAGLSDEQKQQIEKRFEELKRPAPWKRDFHSLSDRLLDVLELRQLQEKGLVDESAVQRSIEEIANGFIGGAIENAEGVSFANQDGKLVMTSEHGAVAFSGRAGRRLQTKQLKALENAATQLTGAAEAIGVIITWAKDTTDEGGDEERFYERQPVEAAARFHDVLLKRMGGMDPDSGLIETMEYQEMMSVVMNATYTLSDIVCANLTPENELTTDERMGNIEAATGEYLQVINAIIMQAYGGGRSSGADYLHVDGQQRNANDPAGVKPKGAAPGAVNPEGKPAGAKPDLTRYDQSVAAARQLVLTGGTPEDLQEALNAIAGAIEEAIPEPEADPAVDALAQRVGGVEIAMSQITALLEEIRDRSAPPGDPAPLADRRDLAPRRRSLAPGPRHAAVPEAPARTGGPMKISEVVKRTTRQSSYY